MKASKKIPSEFNGKDSNLDNHMNNVWTFLMEINGAEWLLIHLFHPLQHNKSTLGLRGSILDEKVMRNCLRKHLLGQ